LQQAGLLAKSRPRGRHRRRREPRPCFGELLHLDGSRHPWLALMPETYFTLIAIVDDATKRLLYAQLVAGGESVVAIMTALRSVLETHRVPIAFSAPIVRSGPCIHPPPGAGEIGAGPPTSGAPCSSWASSTFLATRPKRVGAASA